ncbi:MAG TPA: pentapeptide repeat-containing protein [Solirubrobacteraceae bacterium]|nr:pentapeptide repeat-containing protein [Solirubrobacteraceae bacterium]
MKSLQSANAEPWWQRSGGLGIIGALVAVGGLLWTIVQQGHAFANQKKSDLQLAEREQQERMDGLFARLAADVAADSVTTRVAATASIESFTGEDRSAYHRQLLSLLLAILKVPRGDVGDRVLADAALKFLRSQQQIAGKLRGPLELSQAMLAFGDLRGLDLRGADLVAADLTRAQLDGTSDLSGVSARDLRGRRIFANRARLRGAKLTEANLTEARLRGADLRGAELRRCDLVSADLREAQLRDARLNGAKLQGAHFERSELAGTRFDDADLSDAYFEGAHFDEAAMASIGRARNWQQAHLDESVRDYLAGAVLARR